MDPIQKISFRSKLPLLTKVNGKRKILNKRNKNIYSISHYLEIQKSYKPIIKNIQIIFVFFIIIKIINPQIRKIQSFSALPEITLKINGIGIQKILGYSYHCPNYIYLNNNVSNNLLKPTECNFIDIPSEGDTTINTVKLIWNTKLNNIERLFEDCETIIEADLSKYDSSGIVNMEHMFHHCISIEHINFENFDTSNVITMECLFYECYNLKELDLSSFDTSNVVQMRLLFHFCKSLTSVNVASFDTSKVTDMDHLFFGCHSLKNLSLSNFNTSKVEKMNRMFSECKSLKSLDLSMFDTSSLNDIEYMFSEAESLTSLNLYNFDTSIVTNMKSVFEGCKTLNNLNVSNFVTTEVTNMDYMFKNCNNLKSLDLSSFHTPKLLSMNEMFSECHSLTSLDIPNFQTNLVTTMSSLFKNGQNLLGLNLSSFDTTNVVNMEFMFYNCLSLFSLDLSNFNLNSLTTLKSMFDGCNKIEYINFIAYHDLTNTDSIINILNYTPDNIVICIHNNSDTEKLMQIINSKLCPTIYCGDDWRTKKKIIRSDNTCVDYYIVESTLAYIITTNIYESTYINDYLGTTETLESTEIKESTSGVMGSTENIENNQTPESTENSEPNLNIHSTNIETSYISNNNVESSDERTDTMTNSNSNPYQETSAFSTIKNDESNSTSQEINQRIYEEITGNILENYDGEKKVIKGEDNYVYRVVTTDNMFEDNNETIGLSKIDLGTCEDKLRSTNHLSEDISLIIVSLEKDTNISSQRNVQFEVYESLNKTRLDLSVCEDIPIDIYVPLVLSEELTDLYNELNDLGYNLFDINDKFYTDICTPYKSPNGADILLSDRINYLFNNDETQCQAGCKFSTYSIETQHVKCECNIESSEINLRKGQNEGSKSLYKSFYDVLKYSNYKVLKCYKLAFRLINFKINLGFIIVFIFFIIYLIFLFMYLIKGINQLKIDISRYLFIDNNQRESNNIPPLVIFQEPEKSKNIVSTDEFKLEKKRKSVQIKIVNIKIN